MRNNNVTDSTKDPGMEEDRVGPEGVDGTTCLAAFPLFAFLAKTPNNTQWYPKDGRLRHLGRRAGDVGRHHLWIFLSYLRLRSNFGGVS